MSVGVSEAEGKRIPDSFSVSQGSIFQDKMAFRDCHGLWMSGFAACGGSGVSSWHEQARATSRVHRIAEAQRFTLHAEEGDSDCVEKPVLWLRVCRGRPGFQHIRLELRHTGTRPLAYDPRSPGPPGAVSSPFSGPVEPSVRRSVLRRPKGAHPSIIEGGLELVTRQEVSSELSGRRHGRFHSGPDESGSDLVEMRPKPFLDGLRGLEPSPIVELIRILALIEELFAAVTFIANVNVIAFGE